jgi:alpha-L-rhamnosidase
MRVLAALVRDLRANGNATTARDAGVTVTFCVLLGEGGRSDVILDINSGTDAPDYGHQLAHGATSLARAWAANPGSNHFWLGQFFERLYGDLASLPPDPSVPSTTCCLALWTQDAQAVTR